METNLGILERMREWTFACILPMSIVWESRLLGVRNYFQDNLLNEQIRNRGVIYGMLQFM